MSAKEPGCPLNKFRPCKRHECIWYTNIKGKLPQSDQVVDQWGCAIAWLPVLTVENSQQQRVTHKEINKLRNEVAIAGEKRTAIEEAAYATANRHLRKRNEEGR